MKFKHGKYSEPVPSKIQFCGASIIGFAVDEDLIWDLEVSVYGAGSEIIFIHLFRSRFQYVPAE
jgi:hypothetical protein